MATVTAHVSPDLEPLLIPVERVQLFPGNPRRGDVEAIRLSLRRWGQRKPIVVQKSTGYICAGNHLYQAAVAEGWTHIAATFADLSDTEAKAYALADNQIPTRGDNDAEALNAWLAELQAASAIDEALGFSSEQLDTYLSGISGTEDSKDVIPPERETWVLPGELYALGPHRLLVGDATDPTSYERLCGPELMGMIWTDPPYGVEYVGKTEEELVIANDVDNEEAIKLLLGASLPLAIARTRPGGAVYLSAPGGSMSTLFVGALKELGVYRQTIIWVKDVFVMGHSDYHWRHEPLHNGATPKPEVKKRKKGPEKEASPVHYGWRPGAAHYFVSDRSLDTVWEIPRPKASREHPTMKPVELVERSILASSMRGDRILDPFAGSGTTIIAAERTARIAHVMELEPRYAAVCLDRWQNYTGKDATLVESGETYGALVKARSAP